MSYTKVGSAHTTHNYIDTSGNRVSGYSRYETGIIEGEFRDMLALIADETGFDGLGFDPEAGSDDDKWHVVNMFENGGRYVDSVAIAGALDADHAKTLAITQFDHLGADYGVVVGYLDDMQFDHMTDDQAWSVDAINKLLDNPSQDKHYLPVITSKELYNESMRASVNDAQWDNLNLVSHGGSISTLHSDMLRADTFKELTQEFDLTEALVGMQAEEVEFDSIMDTVSRLPMMKDRLFRAMSQASNDQLSVTNVTQTKPFKRGGVVNIAFVFDLSDGQKLSIWFHNPDSTPSKLLASDMMVSWKWLLNKRDVTAVLSPVNGKEVKIPTLARQMMMLAAKNSKTFKRAQERKAKKDAEIKEVKSEIEQKEKTIEQLDADIASLNKQIDEAMKANKGKADKDTTSNEESTKPQDKTDNKKLTKLPDDKRKAIESFFSDIKMGKQSDELLASMLAIFNHAEKPLSDKDKGLMVGAAARLFDLKELNSYYLDKENGLSENGIKAYNDALDTLNNLKLSDMVDYLFRQDINYPPTTTDGVINRDTAINNQEDQTEQEVNITETGIDFSEVDLKTLSDEELQSLLNVYKKKSDKAQAWRKSMNELQNEGGEGFDFGGREAEKLLQEKAALENEIARRKNEKTFTPEFLVNLMKDYWNELLFINNQANFFKFAEKYGVNGGQAKRKIESVKNDSNLRDQVLMTTAKQLYRYRDNAENKPAYPSAIASLLATMGGYTPSDSKKLLDLANDIINGNKKLLDIVPEDKKQYFTNDPSINKETVKNSIEQQDVSSFIERTEQGDHNMQSEDNTDNTPDIAGPEEIEAFVESATGDGWKLDTSTINSDIQHLHKTVNGVDLLMKVSDEAFDVYTADEEEEVYFSEDGLEVYEAAKQMIEQGVKDYIYDHSDDGAPFKTEPSKAYSEDDIAYLESIINGEINHDDVDMDKVIAIGEKDEDDPLFSQALEVVLEAVDKASADL